ncbi:MAG TPA: S1C family serine protease [Acidimicrobiales bacterium]|nr:S1C family serine protease [Acidimicrobiales bacterium]
MSALDEIGEAVARVGQQVGVSVVRIGRDGGRGAGVVVRDGHVATSAHNLRGPKVTVTFADGRVATGDVKAADIEGDLAVIEVDTSGAPALSWAATGPGLGQVVFALGPGRGGAGRVTAGHVSAVGTAFRGPRGRLIEGAFEHTALVGRGSSGGPVVDASGALVGLNTHRPGDGLYLAVPADEALAARVDSLARGEAPRRPRLGVALVPPHVARRLRAAVGLEERDGLLVRHVDEEGPAAAAGIRPGDLIVAVGGSPVAGIDALAEAVEAHGDGNLAVTVVRGAEELTVEVAFQPPAGGD